MRASWNRWGLIVCFFACGGMGSWFVFGVETAHEVMQAQVDRHGLDYEKEELLLRIVKKNGNIKERQMVRFAQRGEDGSMHMMAILTGPEDIKGTGVLYLRDGGDGMSGQWLYLPALRLAKKISASGKKNNFMGTDFAYEDMRPLDLSAYELRLVGEEDLEGQKCHVVDAIPATPEEQKESGYAKRRIWIRADILFTMKTEFFDKKGQVIKVWVNEGLVQLTPECWRADRMIMTSSKKGRQTKLIVQSRDKDSYFEEDFFSVETLKTWFDE